MEKLQFSVLKTIYNEVFNRSFILVIETNKDCNIDFRNKYVKNLGVIYKVISDDVIDDTTHILVCSKEISTKIYDLDTLFKYNIEKINDYFTDKVYELQIGENDFNEKE